MQITFAQKPDLKIGQKTPDLVITDYILNTPKDKNFSNKYKVVEFWATWCGPCLGAVPHLNQLQNKYKGNENLVFISISDESPEKINKTLSKIKFETIVVSDQSKKSHENLIMNKDKNYSIPATILIDNQNVVQWIGSPNLLTSEIIDTFIKDQSMSSNEVKKSTDDIKKPLEPISKEVASRDLTKIYESKYINHTLIFSESNPNGIYNMASYFDFENARFMYLNWDMKSILAVLNGEPNYKIILADEIANQKYDFIYVNTSQVNKVEEFVNYAKSFLLNKLKMKESKVTVATDVYVLKVKDGKKLEKNENKIKPNSHSGASKEFIVYDNSKLNNVTNSLSGHFNIIILDETNSKNKYDFLFKRGDLDGLINELNDYGLSLEKTKKDIDCIKYEK